MTVEIAEKLVTINPYVMGVILVGTIVVCGGLVHLIIWLVKHIVARKDSVVTDLAVAIDELRSSQEKTSHEMRDTMKDISEATMQMATSLREAIDTKTEHLHKRINSAIADTQEKLAEVHDRITQEGHERARAVVSLGTDIGKVDSKLCSLQGRCDDRARMCPHCNGIDHKGQA